MTGAGAFTKVGTGATTFSGANTYIGNSTIDAGVLAIANTQGIPQKSETFVTGTGRLDLATNDVRGRFKINTLKITEGGQVFVRADQPLVSENIVLDANSAEAWQTKPGGFVVTLLEKKKPPIHAKKKFDYQSGVLVVGGTSTDDPEGRWRIIEGELTNANRLARSTYLSIGGAYKESYAFGGLGERYAVMGPALYKGYLDKGSLIL